MTSSLPPTMPPLAPTSPISSPPGRNATDGFFEAIRRLGVTRSPDRWVGGVAAGVADRFGWDPMVVRGVLFISFFLSGIGLLAYGLGWALLPERSDGRIHLQEAVRGNFDSALLGAGFAVVTGMAWNNGIGRWFHGGLGVLVGLLWAAVWVVGAVFVIRTLRARRPRPNREDPSWPTATGPSPTVPGASATATSLPNGYAAEFPASAPSPSTGQVPTTGAALPDWREAERAARRAEAARRAREAEHAKAYARATKPVVKGPGAVTNGIAVGLILLFSAGLLGARHLGSAIPFFAGYGFGTTLGSAWLGVCLLILGGGIAISGLRGRSSGLLGTLAILGLALGLPVAAMASGPGLVSVGDVQQVWQGHDNALAIGDGVHRSRSIAEAERGYRAQFGQPVLDLTGLNFADASPTDPVVVPITLTAGELKVEVPAKLAVEAHVRLLAGEINWNVGEEPQSLSVVGRQPVTLASDAAIKGDGPVLLLEITAGAGNVTIIEG